MNTKDGPGGTDAQQSIGTALVSPTPPLPESMTRRQRQLHWIGVAYVGVMALCIVADLYLVLVAHVDSISWRTWVDQELHPTLTGAGALAGVGVCYLVRRNWRLVMFNGIMTGHLFFHS